MNTIDKLMANVSFEPNSGCWIWTGGVSGNGYGYANVNGKQVRAHRAVFEAMRRSIPDGGCACHRCDNKLCVNPDHIFIGSHAENMADMRSKHRHRPPIGERSGTAKLTAEQVREIRDMASWYVPHQEIADRFGVTRSHISHIVNRDKWKHIS